MPNPTSSALALAPLVVGIFALLLAIALVPIGL